MLTAINETNVKTLNNVRFRDYERLYLDIQKQFYEQVEAFGLPFDRENSERYRTETEKIIEELQRTGKVDFYNDSKSLCLGNKSTACKACAKGIGTATLFISFHCHRDCYFCFNPNQANFEYYNLHKNDWKAELDHMKASGEKMTHIALTGGEPLLHKDDAVAFFQYVSDNFEDVHTRLYTAGDLLDAALLKRLQKAGLKEIRFSIKLEDTKKGQSNILRKMATAQKYIPDVMVEMPVIPGTLEEMKELLDKLEEMGIYGINLLEFCYPLNNVEEFASRGFKIKFPPHQVLYNFWYAGGLPISGSEYEAAQLLAYAAEKDMKLGVHYCSLENKHFGQIYRQNTTPPCQDKTMFFSEKDFYLKTAKAFGDDAKKAKDILKKNKIEDFEWNNDYHFFQFNPKHIPILSGAGLEIGISYNVQEERDGSYVLRELKLDATTSESFRLSDL
ncbi:MAG: radical SAM protein [Lachnospiraceae bacterium]|nr:radical SAM protein [Lachnospiraceae bacterium]